MAKKIKTYCKLPGRAPYSTNISNRLESLQKLVGGYIETFDIATDATIIVNEEGRINGMPYNCTFMGFDFYGPMYFVGVNGEDFTDMPLSFREFKETCFELWEVK